MPEPRFFIDHGMIHDRETGKHVTTEPDDEIWNGQCITETCALLNSLAPPPHSQPEQLERGKSIILEMSKASDEHNRREKEWRAFMAQSAGETRDFLRYVGEACGWEW